MNDHIHPDFADCTKHKHDVDDLTKNERLVYDALHNAGVPQKAYDLLVTLKGKGVRAPMTVYRALEGLEEKNFIHKLEPLNAFVLCTHHEPHKVQTFVLCNCCRDVNELDTQADDTLMVEMNIQNYLKKNGFELHEARLEIKGTCGKCLADHAPDRPQSALS